MTAQQSAPADAQTARAAERWRYLLIVSDKGGLVEMKFLSKIFGKDKGSKPLTESELPTEVLGKIMETGDMNFLMAALLKDTAPVFRQEATKALRRKIGTSGSVESLISALRDKDRLVQLGAIEELAKIGESAIEPLIAMMMDKDVDVRRAAIMALGKINNPMAVAAMAVALKDEDFLVRWKVTQVLWKVGKPAVELLMTALTDEDWHVRGGAVAALGKIGDIRAKGPLVKLAQNDPNPLVRQTAQEVLEKFMGR